jgi:hypothetical protein
MGHLLTVLAKKRIFAQDGFNRLDNATTMNKLDTGQTWVVSGGIWGILGAGRTFFESNNSNGSVKSTFYNSSATQTQRIIVRYKDDLNEIYFGHTGLGNGYLLSKRVANVTTVIGSAGKNNADGDMIRVRLNGSNIICFVNGVKCIDITETFNMTETKHGLFISTDTVGAFDDFVVEEL